MALRMLALAISQRDFKNQNKLKMISKESTHINKYGHLCILTNPVKLPSSVEKGMKASGS